MTDIVVVQDTQDIVEVLDQPAARVTVVTPGISQSGGGSGSGIVVGDTFEHLEVVNNLPPGGSQVINCDAITNGKIGRLWMIDFSGSIAIKLDVEVVNGSRVKKATIIKSAGDIEPWVPPDPRFIENDGDGTAKFGCTVTNMGLRTSDVKVTLYYDEIDS